MRSKERRCCLSRAAVREANGSGSTAHGLRYVTKAARVEGAIQVKVSVAEEVGGGYGGSRGWP